MSTAEDLLELMSSWIEQRELCADQLRKLAGELESLRKNCKACECVGSSVAVVGTACLVGASLATLFTGGAAAPALATVGAAYSGAGLTFSVAFKIIEGFLSSKPMEEAKKVVERSNEISNKIQQQFKKLKVEVKVANPSANPDELDRHTTSKILTAMARRSGLKGEVSMCFNNGVPEIFLDDGPISSKINNIFIAPAMLGVIHLLSFFKFPLSGKVFQVWFAEKATQLVNLVSSTAFKTTLKGSTMVAGAAVGMVFALNEAIDNWTEMIKKNHVTEASQSLRDTAEKIRKVTQTLREQLDSIKKMFDEMAKHQREQEKEKKKKKRNLKGFFGLFVCLFVFCSFVFAVKPNSLAVNSHGKKEACAERQCRQRSENRQQGGGYEWSRKGESEPRGGDPGVWKSDSSQSITEGHGGFVRMGLLNINSIRTINKPPQVSDLINQEGLQALFLTETKLKPDSGDDDLRRLLPDYRFLQQPREGRGGGVAVLHSEELEAQRIPLGLNASFEYLAALMHHDEWQRPILTITLYRRPGYNIDRFLEELQQLHDKVSNQCESILITGDFNIWVDVKNRKPVKRFREFLKTNGFVQHVKEPTYRSGHTLDLVISKNVDVSNVVVQKNEISDHYTVLFSVRPKKKKKNRK